MFCLSFWGCICSTSIISRRKTLYISENKYCIETLTFDSGNPWHTRTGTTYRSPCSPGTDHSTDLPSLQSPRHRGWVLINARGRTDRRFVLKKSLLPYVTSRNCSKAKEGKSLWKFWCTLCSCLLFDQGNSLKIPIVNIQFYDTCIKILMIFDPTITWTRQSRSLYYL